MADLGLSQARQTGNLGNTPAGATGYPSGSRGDAYGERISQLSGNKGSSQSAEQAETIRVP
jgi:hypothetical protein